MEIEFTVEQADALAFSEYHSEHSEAVKASRRRNTYGYGLGFVAAGVVFLLLGKTMFGLAFMLLGPAWMIFWPKYERDLLRRQMAAMWSEGRNPMFDGSHVLRLEESAIVSISAAGEGRVPLKTVQRVVSTAEFLLIYLGALQAIIVPRRRVVRGDADAFVRELQQRMPGA